jgi:hypothetical protein
MKVWMKMIMRYYAISEQVRVRVRVRVRIRVRIIVSIRVKVRVRVSYYEISLGLEAAI